MGGLLSSFFFQEKTTKHDCATLRLSKYSRSFQTMLNHGAVNRVLFLSPCHHHFPFIRAQPSRKLCEISFQCPPSNTIRAMKKGPCYVVV